MNGWFHNFLNLAHDDVELFKFDIDVKPTGKFV